MDNKDLGAPPASQDRVTDASHEAASASSPSGSVPTGAVDWETGLRICFDRPGFLDTIASHFRHGGFPMLDDELVSWSDWLAFRIREAAPPVADDPYATLAFIAGHDAGANGLTGFAAELIDTLAGSARAALVKARGEQP